MALPNITGGAGGAAMGGTVGPATFGAVTVNNGFSKTTLIIVAIVALIVAVLFFRKRKS